MDAHVNAETKLLMSIDYCMYWKRTLKFAKYLTLTFSRLAFILMVSVNAAVVVAVSRLHVRISSNKD